jgi:hypothetical protein
MVLKLRVPELSLTPTARFNCDPLLSSAFAAPSEVRAYKSYVTISRVGGQGLGQRAAFVNVMLKRTRDLLLLLWELGSFTGTVK